VISLLEHHRRAIDAFVADVVAQDLFQAVILTGSLAQGRSRPDSDIDAYLVVDDEEYVDRVARHDLAFTTTCDYPGGYVDGKVVGMRYLEAAAERGSEPTRASFRDARVVHSTVEGLQALVDRIGAFPEHNRAQNIIDFYCHFVLHAGYFGPSAVKKQDPFLLHHAVTNSVLYAGRLLLAQNRELFPCPKQLLDALARCADLPPGFEAATKDLLVDATPKRMAAYLSLVAGFRDWGVPNELVLTRFMELDEWSWIDGPPSVPQR
jgi:hypothetical protein